jgi:hypothetical protein
MAEKERGSDEPSLELPSLSFRRKPRRKAPEASREAQKPRLVDEVAVPPAPPAPVAAPPAPARPVAAPPAPARPPVAEKPAKAMKETKPQRPRRRRELALPTVGGRAAAVVTGVLVGVITVGLTWAGLRLCEVVRGTSSCGGPGYLLLLGIVVAMVVLGAVLLRAWGVPEPGSTSFLAVVLLAVVALHQGDVLFHVWMILVLPACSALTFAASQWVTATFVEPAR